MVTRSSGEVTWEVTCITKDWLNRSDGVAAKALLLTCQVSGCPISRTNHQLNNFLMHPFGSIWLLDRHSMRDTNLKGCSHTLTFISSIKAACWVTSD